MGSVATVDDAASYHASRACGRAMQIEIEARYVESNESVASAFVFATIIEEK